MALRPFASFRFLLNCLIRKLIFSAIRLVFLAIQAIWWRISGTQAEIDRRKVNTRSEGKCAQAFRIISWCKPDVLMPISLKDFILTHDEFIDPRYVIENDHVYLFFLDPHKDVAVFGEGEDGMLMWESKYSPFITITMFMMSKRLIVMPMSTFHELCDQLPDPKGKLIMVTNTARCGSTLMVQIFEYTKKVITYSEPNPFRDLAFLQSKKGLCKEVLTLARNLVRMYCRPLKSLENPEGYLIKPTGAAMPCIEAVKAVYPDTVFFYLYRDMTKVSLSFFKLSFVLASIRLMYLLGRLSGPMLQKALADAGFPKDGISKGVKDDFSCGVLLAVYTSSAYHSLRKQGVNIHAILFDELLKNRDNGVKTIFKLCGLSMDSVEDAMKSFDQDSQGGSILSREVFAAIPPLEYKEDDRVRASQFLVEFGYPPIDQPTVLEGTLNLKTIQTK